MLEIPVHYEHTRWLLPRLIHTLVPTPELVINIGVGREGSVALEHRARHGPYHGKDNAHRTPKDHVCPGYTVKEMCTNVPVHKLRDHLRNKGWEHVRCSNDAGLYLCEWTYFISQNETDKDALFIHVPPVDKPYSLEELSHIVRDAVVFLVNSVNKTLDS
jgi:pyroglutamyl-peptidase